MSVFNSVGTPLVVLMVLLLVVGMFFGTAISDSGYLNPATSNAQAVRMNAETVHQQVLFTQQERLSQAQTDAQIQTIKLQKGAAEQQIEVDLNYQKQRNEKRLVAYEKFMDMLTNIAWVIGITTGLVLTLVLGLFLGSKAIVSTFTKNNRNNPMVTNNPPSQVPSVDIWQSPEFREQMIKNARNNEVVIRQMVLSQVAQTLRDPASMTKEQWEQLPRAE